MTLEEVLKQLSALPEKQREEAVALAVEATKTKRWIPNPGPQTEAYFSPADEIFYGGQAGGGKALANHMKILTPFGWKEIGDIKVGDKLCATDGSVQEVLGVYPQGVRPLYWVKFRDGGKVLADLDHNWLAWRTHNAKKKTGDKYTGKDAARKWTTKQIMDEMAEGRRADDRVRAFAIPATEPVAFTVAGQLKGRDNFVRRPVDPYLLGVILGDGHIGDVVRVTTADAEIVSRVRMLAGDDVAVDPTASAAVSLRFRGAGSIELNAGLEALALTGTKAETKFIPRQYLFAPIADRWELLRGLMDTDGWVEPKRACYYTTVSGQLADDVEHLARSLGAVTYRTDKHPTYTYQGEKRQGQKAYCIRIKLPNPAEAFALTRKKLIAAETQHQSMSRVIESIEYAEDAEATCITVSHPNSLYITEDFIVTHNTDLAAGLAIEEHDQSLILRHTSKEARGIADRIAEIMGTRNGLNQQLGTWNLGGGKIIEFGGCEHEEDKQKYKGRPHDLIVFDEVSDFTKTQYVFIQAWNRSVKPGQRCRVLATGNPPTTPEGLWVLERWAAWLDPNHPNPAMPGELRWFTTNEEGQEIEVNGPGPHWIGGEQIIARSRTFIPAALSDNPDLAATNYGAVMAALPDDLRRAYRDGQFLVALEDNSFQAIPTSWVKAAQARWTPEQPQGVPMCAMGIDVAQGGPDRSVLAARFNGWFPPLKVYPGKQTPDGKTLAGLVLAARRDSAVCVVDLGGGWGGDCYGHLKENGIESYGYMGVKESSQRTADGARIRFKNVRTEAYWRLREALDPSRDGGSVIALPPDNELVADLCTPKYVIKGSGASAVMELTAKVDVAKVLGRSPDKGDAVVMAWYKGLTHANMIGGNWTPKKHYPTSAGTKRGSTRR